MKKKPSLLEERLKNEKDTQNRKGIQDRYDKWVAAGRPKAADWSKAGAGRRGLSGPLASKSLQKRVAAEPNRQKKDVLLNRYDKWLDAGRPKMDAWVKQGAGGLIKTPPKTAKAIPWKDTNVTPTRTVANTNFTDTSVAPRDDVSKNAALLSRIAKNRLANPK